MTKKNKTVAPDTNWEDAPSSANVGGEWETLPSGFAPLWKPQEGDTIIFTPQEVHAFKNKTVTKKNKGSSKGKTNLACTGVFRGGSRKNFYTGSGKGQREVEVGVGESVAIGLSYNMLGEDKIAMESGELSSMSLLLAKEGKAFLIRFDGKVPIGGGKSVNNFTISVPAGFREKLLKSK